MARPSTTTPFAAVVLPGLGGPVTIENEPLDVKPADLNGAWRAMMTSLGVNLPAQLNRAVAVVNRGHGWAK